MQKNATTSPKYNQIYDYIVAFKKAHDGNSPTIREIGDAVGVSSTSQANHYLDVMVKLGMITRDGKFRMIGIPGGVWSPPTGMKLLETTR
jgi:SOS-response transcriptional repressor LexA